MSEHPTPPTPEREPSGEERAAYGQTSGAPGSGWGAPHAGPSAGHTPPPQATDTPAAFNPTPFAPPVPVQPRPRRQRRIWPAEIGRASCRERVKVMEGAGSRKKKQERTEVQSTRKEIDQPK